MPLRIGMVRAFATFSGVGAVKNGNVQYMMLGTDWRIGIGPALCGDTATSGYLLGGFRMNSLAEGVSPIFHAVTRRWNDILIIIYRVHSSCRWNRSYELGHRV